MNALQDYVNSLVGIQETAKIDLVKQWKVDNNWNDKKNELVDIEVETNIDPEEVKIKDPKTKVDPSLESSDNTGSESVNGSSAPIDPLEGLQTKKRR